MEEIDIKLHQMSETICKNIENIEILSRGVVSQNILATSRTLVEHIAMKAYSIENHLSIEYDCIKDAMEYIKQDDKYLFLRKFHLLLQESKSHYYCSDEDAERLFLKYYNYFILIKNFVKNEYNLTLFENIENYPLNTDKTIQEYYDKISEIFEQGIPFLDLNSSERFYVKKIKSFFSNGKIYYENTLIPVGDNVSKTDRFIVFSDRLIPSHYAINVSIYTEYIWIQGNKMEIKILDGCRVSIRPCELNNFAKYFGYRIRISSRSAEYKSMMEYLSKTGASLTDIATMSDQSYENICNKILQNAKSVYFLKALDECRDILLEKKPGCNVLAYLLATLNNRVLKRQYYYKNNGKLSDLYLQYGCIPFDDMPFASSLIDHIPEISEVFDCIDPEGRQHEFLGRYVQNNAKINRKLYTSLADKDSYSNIDTLIDMYNQNVYKDHPHRKMDKFGKNKLYIKGDVENTEYIIRKIQEYAKQGVKGYNNSISSWLQDNAKIDSSEKREILSNMFSESCVSLIYGAAGTGKTYLINHISQFFDARDKLYLSNTHPAVENLRRNISAQKVEFSTVRGFLSENWEKKKYDILIVDECSMISNQDMRKVLQKIVCKLIIFVGDIYQIESIEFGNWFELARYFVKKEAWNELEKPYRTNKDELLELWKRVRNLNENIAEQLIRYHYSSTLDKTIFNKQSEDEIILCLNYDGLYGINNINRFLQNNNENKAYKHGVWTYKVDDPILFNENNRFAPVLYNNLKGKIIQIDQEEEGIFFSVEIDKAINEWDADDVGLELLESGDNGKSIVRFFVSNPASTDEDDQNKDTIVPFQVAYAVSIHKAQGLEYDSVKIIITEEIDERITHNIFYTAITRSKNKLKIYWSPESQQKVLSRLERVNVSNDATIFAAQTGLKKIKVNVN